MARTSPLISAELPLGTEEATSWVVVDSMVDGLAIGGTRMTSTVDRSEVERLAAAMSTKLALAGLRVGGAKAGISMKRPHHGQERDRLLTAFGESIAPFLRGGVYLGCDQGVTPEDRERFFAVCGYAPATDLPVSWQDLWSKMHDITGYGVGVAVQTTLAASGGITGRRAVVQGFGAVGRAAARFLSNHGHKIVAVADVLGTIESPQGLPVDELITLTNPAGTIDRTRLPNGVRLSASIEERWCDVDADIMVLAAGADSVDTANAHRIQTGIVVEGGNYACAADAREKLHANGVTVLPDVIANVGGAAVTASLLAGVVPKDLSLDQLCHWLRAWVGNTIAMNSRRAITAAQSGEPDVVAALLRERNSTPTR